jgi:hypothetical protein
MNSIALEDEAVEVAESAAEEDDASLEDSLAAVPAEDACDQPTP